MKNKLTVTRNLIKESLASQPGDFGNKILYEMCKKHPLHNKNDIILGKVWLIGRAYAAAIERRKKFTHIINDDFYEKKVGCVKYRIRVL